MTNEYGEPVPRFAVGDIVNHWNRTVVVVEWIGGPNREYRIRYDWLNWVWTIITPERELTAWRNE